VAEDRERLGAESDGLGIPPEALVRRVEAKGWELDHLPHELVV
jgi:hypothetical protein